MKKITVFKPRLGELTPEKIKGKTLSVDVFTLSDYPELRSHLFGTKDKKKFQELIETFDICITTNAVRVGPDLFVRKITNNILYSTIATPLCGEEMDIRIFATLDRKTYFCLGRLRESQSGHTRYPTVFWDNDLFRQDYNENEQLMGVWKVISKTKAQWFKMEKFLKKNLPGLK